MHVPTPSALPRETLEKILPVFVAIAVVWLCARGLSKLFWTVFGLYWALRWMV